MPSRIDEPSERWWVPVNNSFTFEVHAGNSGSLLNGVSSSGMPSISYFPSIMKRPLEGFWANRSAFFLPNILDMLVVGVIWALIYAPKYGVLAQITSTLLGENNFFNTTGLLGSPYTALLAVIFAMTLKGAGFGMVLFLAALQNIPADVYEAADIDGASEWEKFYLITVPLLRPIIFFMVITGIIGSLNAFTEIYAMTAGGPQVVIGGEAIGSTSVAGYYLYKQFDAGNYGYAAAISYIMLIITLGITYIQQKLAAKKAGAKK